MNYNSLASILLRIGSQDATDAIFMQGSRRHSTSDKACCQPRLRQMYLIWYQLLRQFSLPLELSMDGGYSSDVVHFTHLAIFSCEMHVLHLQDWPVRTLRLRKHQGIQGRTMLTSNA